MRYNRWEFASIRADCRWDDIDRLRQKGGSAGMKARQRLNTDGVNRKRRRLPAEARRAELLKAARAVFSRHGLEGARVRDIAREANANIATLFHYFKTKEDLFEAAVLQPLDDFISKQSIQQKEFVKGSISRRRAVSELSNEHELSLILDLFPLLSAALFSNRKRSTVFYNERLFPKLNKLGRLAISGLPYLKKRGLTGDLLTLAAFGIHFAIAMDVHYRRQKFDVHKAALGISNLLLYGVERSRNQP